MSETVALIAQSVAQAFSAGAVRAAQLQADVGTLPTLWAQAVESGFTQALVPDALGGMGLTFTDALPILRGIGQFHVPLPLADTMLAAPVLTHAGLRVGDAPVALATVEEPSPERLSGAFSRIFARVAWGAQARWLLVEHARQGKNTSRLMLIDLHHPSVQRRAVITPGETIPPEPAAVITCANTPVQGLENPYPVSLLSLLAFVRSAQMSGAIDAAHALTVRYAQERSQFGKPIASFQAVAQQLAEAAGEAAMARIAVEVAARSLSDPAETPQANFHIVSAKIIAGEAATKLAAICHQVHGAIGYTAEYPLHHFTTRLWAWRREGDSESTWAEHLGRAVIAAGGAQFWSNLTSASFPQP